VSREQAPEVCHNAQFYAECAVLRSYSSQQCDATPWTQLGELTAFPLTFCSWILWRGRKEKRREGKGGKRKSEEKKGNEKKVKGKRRGMRRG